MNESELLFSHRLGVDCAGLYRKRHNLISREDSYFFSCALNRRIRGEPLQYIIGKADFFGLEFSVNPSVLIPRPETELLVEKVIVLSKECGDTSPELRILDIGTGSGCIAISLAKALPGARITAVDISPEALAVAGENARHHAVAITLVRSDLVNVFEKEARFDIIVSNPPYIKAGELKDLQPEVHYEPLGALDGGRDGLDFYRRLAAECPAHLKKGGYLVVEIGHDQRHGIEDIFQGLNGYGTIRFLRDYNQKDRIAVIKKTH